MPVDEQGRAAALEALHERWKKSDIGYQIKIVDLILNAYEAHRSEPESKLTPEQREEHKRMFLAAHEKGKICHDTSTTEKGD